MLRAGKALGTTVLKVRPSTASGKTTQRLQSTKAGGGGAGKLVVGVLGVGAVGASGVTAYAAYDKDYRRLVESKVPGSDKFFKQVLGETKEIDKPKKQGDPPPSLLQKKKDRTPKPSDDVATKPIPHTMVHLTKPPTPDKLPEIVVTPAVVAVSDVQTEKQPEQETKEHTPYTIRDSKTEATNEILSSQLNENIRQVERLSANTDRLYQLANESVRDYTKLLKTTLEVPESEKEKAWQELSGAEHEKNVALHQAEQAKKETERAIETLNEIVSNARSSRITATNRSLLTADKTASAALYSLQQADAQISEAQSEARIQSKHRDSVEKSWDELKEGLKSILPNVITNERGERLTEEELNIIISHAHERLEFLQKQLQLQKTSENERLGSVLDKQRSEWNSMTSERIAIELAKQQRDLDLILRRKEVELSEQFEIELRQQLRRQAAAHSDHLHDVLAARNKELAQRYERKADTKVAEAREAFQYELAGSLAKLTAMDDGIKNRAQVEADSLKAQSIWLVCSSLMQAVRSGPIGAKTWHDKRKPLKTEIDAVTEVAEGDPFVQTLLSTMPDLAIHRGVFTADALRERFVKVYQMCRRVALVDDSATAGLLTYALSWLQSSLIAERGNVRPDDSPVDPNSLHVYELLGRAKYYLDRDDLEMTLRYMNQLKGASRVVASDWLAETRLLLETRQVAEALITRAAATNIQSTR